MLAHLDKQKEKAIETTFVNLSKHFKDVFKEIVPQGSANIKMVRDTDGLVQGVEIKVSFVGSEATTVMSQLSGGQKTVVAVSLLFAIQRCDPAPFQIFDEIDAALDQNYRTSLAKLIQKHASSAQYIITTFKSELLNVTDNIIEVRQMNKVSRAVKGTVEKAREIVNNISMNVNQNNE